MKKKIDGLTVTIDEQKASDWHAFQLVRKANSANQIDQMAVMFEFIGYVTDQDEQSIIEHLGGDTAQVQDVVALVSKIVAAVTPKN